VLAGTQPAVSLGLGGGGGGCGKQAGRGGALADVPGPTLPLQRVRLLSPRPPWGLRAAVLGAGPAPTRSVERVCLLVGGLEW